MSGRYGDRVVVVRAPEGAVGRNGLRARDWSTAARSRPVVASVQPQTSGEDDGDQQTTIESWRLFAGPSTDLLATDRVEWPGLVDPDTGRPVQLEVDGEVARWRHRGRPHHVEAVRRRVATS